MKLTLTILAASLVLRFVTPGPGSFYLLSTQDGWWWEVEMSDHVETVTHVEFQVPTSETHRWFAVQWEGEQ